jgi:hypothetical protein
VIKKARPVKPAPNPYLTAASVDELSPANRVAHDITSDRRDLLASVERIMNAGLSPDATFHALTLFRDSLTDLDDPHRDPRAAIATANQTATANEPVTVPPSATVPTADRAAPLPRRTSRPR